MRPRTDDFLIDMDCAEAIQAEEDRLPRGWGWVIGFVGSAFIWGAGYGLWTVLS